MTTTTTYTLGLSAIDQIGLTCTDLDEAQRFYCDVLGLTLADDVTRMAKLFGCNGVNLILFKADSMAPASVVYFEVDGKSGAIEAKVDQLPQAGVEVEKEPQCIAKDWHGHDMWLAFFRDPFSNLLALKSDVPVG